MRKHAVILIAVPGVLAQVCSTDSTGEKQFKTTCQPCLVSAGSQSAISFLQLLNVNVQQCSFSIFRKLITSVSNTAMYTWEDKEPGEIFLAMILSFPFPSSSVSFLARIIPMFIPFLSPVRTKCLV